MEEKEIRVGFHHLCKQIIIWFVMIIVISLTFFGLAVYSMLMMRYQNNGEINWVEDHYETRLNVTNNGIFPVEYSYIAVAVYNSTGAKILSGQPEEWVAPKVGAGMTYPINIIFTNSSPVFPGDYNITIGSYFEIVGQSFSFVYRGICTIL
jgi:hypothetical protein